jgi:hypothetical protein
MEPAVDTENDKDFKGALDDVLGFYGMQLQSHAATLISLSIAIFAVFSLRPGGVVGALGSALAISVLVTIAVYTLLRLVVYGGLSRTILYGNFQTVNRFASIPQWKGALPQTKVSHYTHSCFNEIWRDKKHWRVFKGSSILNEKDQPRTRILLLAWIVVFITVVVFSLPT